MDKLQQRPRTISLAWSLWLCALLPVSLPAGQNERWPAIKPLTLKYHFRSMKEAKLKAMINAENGKPQYILECYSSQTIPQTGEFMYSGDFECRLHSFNSKEQESTLLTELPDADKDWESRGRFLVGQLLPPCGDYKELGRQRSFRLRGFRLELVLTNITFDDSQPSFSGAPPALRSLDLEVRAEPDSTATSAISSTPALPRPDSIPKACQKAFDTLYLDQFRQ